MRVQPAGRHVDRAEAAMRGVVGRAELLRPPAGQRLRLVAAGEEGEFVGIAFADRRQPAGGDVAAPRPTRSRGTRRSRARRRAAAACRSRAGE